MKFPSRHATTAQNHELHERNLDSSMKMARNEQWPSEHTATFHNGTSSSSSHQRFWLSAKTESQDVPSCLGLAVVGQEDRQHRERIGIDGFCFFSLAIPVAVGLLGLLVRHLSF